MITRIQTNTGLIKMLVVILIILLVLAYFGLNLRTTVNSPTFQDNWSFLTTTIATVWNDYLKVPFDYLWYQVFIPLIWDPLILHLTQMKTENANVISPSAAPQMPQQGAPQMP